MLQLEARRKLTTVVRDRMSAWRNHEDVLTALVFGTAAHQPFEAVMGPLLRNASMVFGKGFPAELDELAVQSADLWPNWKGQDGNRVQPEAAWDLGGAAVVVEVKHNWVHSTSQLLSEFGAAASKYPDAASVWLLAVGLGLHLDEDISKEVKDQRQPGWSLLYLPWTRVPDILSQQTKRETAEGPARRALLDLIQCLRGRNLREFAGCSWPRSLGALEDIVGAPPGDWLAVKVPPSWPPRATSTIDFYPPTPSPMRPEPQTRRQ